MENKKKVVKTYVEMDQGIWQRFKEFLKSKKGMTLRRGHEDALKKYMGEKNE